MVIIRLARGGAKKRPFYHIVVTNSRNPRDGRFIERLGFYNPIATGGEVKLQLNKERIDYWIAKGAQVSERVDHLLKNFAEINMETSQEKPKQAPQKKKVEPKPAAEVKVEEPKAEEKPEPAETPAESEEK